MTRRGEDSADRLAGALHDVAREISALPKRERRATAAEQLAIALHDVAAEVAVMFKSEADLGDRLPNDLRQAVAVLEEVARRLDGERDRRG